MTKERIIVKLQGLILGKNMKNWKAIIEEKNLEVQKECMNEWLKDLREEMRKKDFERLELKFYKHYNGTWDLTEKQGWRNGSQEKWGGNMDKNLDALVIPKNWKGSWIIIRVSQTHCEALNVR